LAINLFIEIPAEALKPVSSKMRSLISLAMSLAEELSFLFSVTSN